MKTGSRKIPKTEPNPVIETPKSPGLLIFSRDRVKEALKKSREERTTPVSTGH